MTSQSWNCTTRYFFFLKHLKNGKAAGLDEILTEEIKNFGPITTQWVLSLLISCARTHRLPRLWRQARVVALLKPGKDPSSPKSFRPISLLCHLYKLYERLILNRLSPIRPNKKIVCFLFTHSLTHSSGVLLGLPTLLHFFLSLGMVIDSL